jgi:glutathione synthase/RimK-type ligase-like ATP-grasp enzyme
MKTGRISNAQRLAALPGVVTPKTLSVARDLLAGPDGAAWIAGNQFTLPLLLRSPGYHTGRNFILIEKGADLAAAAAGLPGSDLLVIEYLDARGSDGSARKYRVMMIDRQIYPMHLAISRNWKVHYFTSDMADQPDHRAEELAFLSDMPAVLGDKAMAALAAICDVLGLDYAGVDFGLGSDGDLLLFEANATMVIAAPDPDPRWEYRRTAITGIIDAVVEMIRARARAGSAKASNPAG